MYCIVTVSLLSIQYVGFTKGDMTFSLNVMGKYCTFSHCFSVVKECIHNSL